MTMQERYFARMREVLARVEASQPENIARCAQVIADALVAGGAWHVLDTGHMLMYEAIGRSGGLMAVRPVRVSVEVANPVRRRRAVARKKQAFMDEIEGLPRYILDKSDMLPGDVLLLGSVSGINMLPVGLALEARARGITTIALTAVEYSRFLRPAHPSGKRLFEVCDHVLDNCAPVGDTLVEVAELDQGICPASGIAASYVMWALQAEVVEALLERGKTPHVYVSNHMPGAEQRNKDAWAAYEEYGF